MKNIVIALLATIVVAGVISRNVQLSIENRLLERNQHALEEGITLYRTEAGDHAASVEALTLELDAFKRRHEEDVAKIRELGIRLRRVESYARSVTATTLRDTIILRDTVMVGDTTQYGTSMSPWTRIAALLHRDTLTYTIESIDTLHQVIHRVPRKFWFIRYGTKAIRQEITSSNPNTKLVYTEYIEIK